VGSWKRVAAGEGIRVDFTLAQRYGAPEEAALAAEAERYGEHLGKPVDIAIAEGELGAAA
jgi:hypothetical protein